YRIEMDLLQNDFSKDNLMAFRFKGAHEHWSFNEINWNQKDSSFIACTKINEHFAADGLQIQSLTISSSSAQSTSCLPIPSQKSQSQSMFCGDKQIAYAAPVVDNPIPRTKAPQINSLQNGSRSNSISLDITSALPISSAEVTLDAMANGSSPISQLIYDDQISVGHSEITFNQSRIPPGFTRVVLINIVDTVGNASRLKAEPGEANYKLYSTDGPPTETQIPVISLMGPSK
ncbi:MAG TPA: hypothetical protein VN132_01480, partial [Bdellovibrio sp.]|nr:hypothetical protein [Bdellovibrio sp.]